MPLGRSKLKPTTGLKVFQSCLPAGHEPRKETAGRACQTTRTTKMNELSIRLIIALNDCAVGPRMERGAPLPPYRHSYPDTAVGRAQAEYDLARLKLYQEQHATKPKIKK